MTTASARRGPLPSSSDEQEIACELIKESIHTKVTQHTSSAQVKTTVYSLVPRPDIAFSQYVLVRPKLPSEEGGDKVPEHVKALRKITYSDLVFSSIG